MCKFHYMLETPKIKCTNRNMLKFIKNLNSPLPSFSPSFSILRTFPSLPPSPLLRPAEGDGRRTPCRRTPFLLPSFGLPKETAAGLLLPSVLRRQERREREAGLPKDRRRQASEGKESFGEAGEGWIYINIKYMDKCL